MSEGTKRRLAAIVSADVVGYSRLMGVDEAGTLAAMKAHRRELWIPTIERFGCRVVGGAGDSILVEYSSAVAAAEASIAVQRAMVDRNANLPEDRRMFLRIGINIGEVIVDGDDIYGDGVNVAARMQEIAEPGGIAVSDIVRGQVHDKLDVAFADDGTHEVKNIAQPVHVWRWPAEGQSSPGSAASAEAKPLPLPDKPSIAVLAFDNLSGDPDQEYFADGVAEDIITALSKFRWFFVIARNSSFTYKGKSVDVKQVGEELGVRYVLEGSVRKVGSRVRISAQLINAATGNHVWAERYDRELTDIFELQDQMTTTIVGTIEPELGDAERERAKRKPTNNLDAWDQYQRGLWHHYRFTEDDLEKAEQLFQSAIELDPGFSRAHANLAYVLLNRVSHGWSDAVAETLGRAMKAGRQAVSLDDKDAFAHMAAGRSLTLRGEFETAIAELEKALDLNPNLANAYHSLGYTLYWSGRAEEALPFFHKAMRHSPHDPLRWTFEYHAGTAHAMLSEYEEAIEWYRKASRHATSGFWPHVGLVFALAELDRLEAARAALDDALSIRADLSVSVIASVNHTMHLEYRERYLDALRKVGLPE